jgi:serine/threonine-protein kinase
LIGLGGTGAVFKARTDGPEQKVVALKVLQYDNLRKAEFLGLVKDEMAALSRLDHPNIVRIRDFGQKNDLYYLVTDFIDGVNFSRYLSSFNLEPGEAHNIMVQLCRAVDRAHRQGVLHGNLKPSNIIMGPRQVMVTDFSLARLTTGSYLKPNLVRSNAARETLNYAAPELRFNSGPLDERADIYALGALYYQMLTGHPPAGLFSPPSRLRTGLNKTHDRLIGRCLAPDPRNRYPAVEDLLNDLDQLGARNVKSKRTGLRSVLVVLAVLSMALYLWLEWPIVWTRMSRSPAARWLPATWLERYAPERMPTGPVHPVRPRQAAMAPDSGREESISPPPQPAVE